MAKKEKARKKTDDEIRVIEFIKNYLNKYSAKSNLIRNIDFKEQTNDGFLRFIASIDYGNFEQRIVYYPNMLFKEHFVDVEFSIGETDNIYTFYDIFNLFDISDFNLYFYSDFLCEDDVKKALDEIMSATEKYFSDIERAQTSAYLPQLEKNYETDMNNAYGGDDWKEDEPFGFVLPFNHPYYPIAENSIKTLKKLQKRNAKNKLDTIYEKRLLKYLESGNAVREKKQAEKTEFEKLYKKKKMQTNLLLFAATAAVVCVLCLGIHAVIYAGAETFKTQYEIFGVLTTLPVFKIILGFLAALVIDVGITVPFFGEKLILASMPENYRKKTVGKYEIDRKDFFGDDGPVTQVIGTVMFVVIAALLIYSLSSAGIGYYEDSVKFSKLASLDIVTIPYEEIEIYKLEGYYEDDEEFASYENAYAIADGDQYYSYGEILPNGQTQTKLEEIAEKYNKDIKEIKSIEELYENSGN